VRKRKGERRKGRGECEEEERIEEVWKWRKWWREKNRGRKEEENVRRGKEREGKKEEEESEGMVNGWSPGQWEMLVSGLLMRGCLHA
jgi:hypothetical protein